jgi:hypothetical protein
LTALISISQTTTCSNSPYFKGLLKFGLCRKLNYLCIDNFKFTAMTTEEKPLSPKESLQLITDAIVRTKENIKKNSFPFLLWGWLIAIASFSFFLLHQYTSFQYFFLPFPVLVLTGIICTIIFYKNAISTSTISYLNNFLYKMWLVIGISFIVVVFINVSQSHLPFTYTLLLAAIGTLLSGLVMKFTPMTIGGILFFISTIVSIYVPDDFKPLLTGMAIICGYLVPGYLLKSTKA